MNLREVHVKCWRDIQFPKNNFMIPKLASTTNFKKKIIPIYLFLFWVTWFIKLFSFVHMDTRTWPTDRTIVFKCCIPTYNDSYNSYLFFHRLCFWTGLLSFKFIVVWLQVWVRVWVRVWLMSLKGPAMDSWILVRSGSGSYLHGVSSSHIPFFI